MFPKPFDNWGKHVNCYPRLVPIIKKNTNDSPDTNMLNMHDIAEYLMYICLNPNLQIYTYIDDIIYNLGMYIYIYDKYMYIYTYIPCICMASISSTRNLPAKPKPRLPNRSITRRHLVALPRPSCHGGHPGVPGRGTGGDGHDIATWVP